MLIRNQTADVLKGIGILLMIQVHVLELFATNDVYVSSLGKFLLFLGGPPVAPVFMIVFGYFIASSNKSNSQLIIRGIKIFLLGMLLNLALNFNLIFNFIQGKIHVDIWPYVFGVDILQFAGISMIVITLCKRVVKRYIILGFILVVVCSLLGEFLLNYVPENITLKYASAFLYGSSEWSYFPLLPWISYPLAGILWHQLQQRYDFGFLFLRKNKILLGTAFLLFLILTIKYAISISSQLPLYYHHGTLFFMWIIIFLVFYSIMIHEINYLIGETKVIKYLMWLGKNVTIIYVIQWIIIGNIATEIYKSLSSPLYLIISVIVVFLLSISICYSLLKLKRSLF